MRPPTTIVCARLTPGELALLDGIAANRSEALRTLVGHAEGSGLFEDDQTLPVLWWRLLGEVEGFARRCHTRPPGLLKTVDAIHREDYPAALDAFQALLDEWEPSTMVWPPQ